MKALCSAATSRCAPMPARSACDSNFTRKLSQFASVPSMFGMPMVFVHCVENATCISCHAARAWGQSPSNNCITRAAEEDESSCFKCCLMSEIRNDFSSCKILLNLTFGYTINSLVNSRRDLRNRSVYPLMVSHSSLCCVRTSFQTNVTNFSSNFDPSFDEESRLVSGLYFF